MRNRILNKWLAALLIVLIANPMAITSAYARDSDIFLSVTTGVSTAEPNIMIILDTSDSMNTPEAWREYPPLPSTGPTDEVNYDSHVEYLWNDCTFIRCSGGEQTVASTTVITTAAATVLTPPGSWAGATLAERQTLWNAAKTYANATEPGDPGPRTTYRNYNDPSWIYWLPRNAPLTDARLQSPTFNRWRGGIGTRGGTRGGIVYSGTTDYRGNNKCRDSGTDPAVSMGHAISGVTVMGAGVSSKTDPGRTDVPQGLVPSTIYAPSGAPRNSGRYLDTYWRRWDPYDWQSMRYGRVSPGDTTYQMPASVAGNPIDWSNATPAPSAPSADCSVATNCYRISAGPGFGNDTARIRAQNEFLLPSGAAGRDSWPAVPNYGDNVWYLGYRGQPIRVQVDKGARNVVDDSEDSRSRWTRLNADLGGFNFAESVNGYNPTVLTNVLSVYDAYLTIPGAGGDPRGRAWRGNRDAANLSDWHYTVGTPAYVDSQVTEGQIFGGSLNTVNIRTSQQGANGFAVNHWINIPTAGAGGTTLVTQITAITASTITISPVAAQATGGNVVITRNFRLITGAPQARCQVAYTLDADGGQAGNQAAFAATTNNDGSNTARYFTKSDAVCVAGAATPAAPGNDCTGVTPANKAPTGSGDYYTAVYNGCAWSGRQSRYVEGVGTYYYGGTCGTATACRGVGYGPGSTACVTSSDSTVTYSSSSYVVNSRCSVSGVSNLTVGSTPMAGAVLNSATSGCGNRANVQAACPAREVGVNANCSAGTTSCAGCVYGKTTCSTDVWYTGGSTTDYAAFHNIGRVNELVHDCTADDGTIGNPGTSTTGSITSGGTTVTVASTAGFAVGMSIVVVGAGPGGSDLVRNVNSILGGPARLVLSGPAGTTVAGASVFAGGSITNTMDKPFGNGWAASVSNAANNAAPYSTDGAHTFGNGSGSTRADMYSVNYLNFKFGPKGPNGYPIGRKTRLQIAKDALTGLVATTDGVRFGLMVFNRTAGCTSGVGTIDVTIDNTLMNMSDNPGFVVGQAISITGAGPGGATLNTTIASIAANNATDPPSYDFTIAAAATLSVSNTNVQANPCSGAVTNEGSNVASRVLRMGANATDLPDYNNRATLNTAINNAVAAARTPLTESLYEAYLYYSGRAPRFGTATASAIVGGTVTQGRDTQAVCAAGGTQDCPLAGRYRSPMLNNPNTSTAPAGCQKNFIILITDGGPEDDWSANNDIKRMQYAGALGQVATRTTLDANEPNTTTDQFEIAPGVPYGPVDLAGTGFDNGYIWLDELAYFMAIADVSPGARNLPGDAGTDLIAGRQPVITYTVGFAGGNSPVLSNTANRSGATYYLANQADQLQQSLTAAITAIRDWSPTVAAPTVPISALNRAENATDVYLAFFQPDPTQAWLGTVKKFQLSTDPTKCGPVDLCLTGQTQLTKAAPNFSPSWNIETLEVDPVTNTQQSVVDANTVSFWGPLTLTDGGHADNGGTGYQLVNTAGYNPSTRVVYTFFSGASASTDLTDGSNVMNESNAGITKTMLGNPGMTDAQRATLINYLRGGDPADTNCSDANIGTACATWRAWPHFDVQHSKPAVVLYDATASPVTEVLYYLSNDGLLHAVNTATGQELWSFLIEETFPKAATLMADNAGPQADAGDGSIAVWVKDVNGDNVIQSGDQVYLYFGLRRGGRAYYALDVTDRLAPKFKWKITADTGSGQVCVGTGACNGTTAFNELGQTWSTPSVVKLRALGTATPALVFGGGYDAQEDGVPPAASANTMGRALYVVNGDTAAVLNWWGPSGAGTLLTGAMSYAIPSDVTALNTDLDAQGFADRVYVGDMGGQVWRFDIDDAAPASWRGGLLADLSPAAGQRRKIFFPPAAAHQAIQGGSTRFDAVYVGTGDREHPRLTSTTVPPTVPDMMFMIMDRDQGLMQSGGAAASFAAGDFLQLANSTLTGVDPAALATKKGWYRELDDGEKVINAPTIFLQRLQFGTYAPLSQINACTPPGEGRLNEIDGLLGALLPINGTSVSTPQDRYYASFLSRGLLSTTQLVVIGKGVYTLTCADGICQGKRVYTIGDAAKMYWYMEPEQ